MKKLIALTFTLFLTAGLALGQSNEADVDITGDENEPTIEQHGFSNEAFIYQIGNSNGEETNGTYIYQIGADNTAEITTVGDDNDADIAQDGQGHVAEVIIAQGADENEINVTQWDEDHPSTLGNHMDFRIYEPSGTTVDGNDVDVTQHGEGNKLSGLVIGDDNDIEVEQYGLHHTILGGGGLRGEWGVRIIGDDNDAIVLQTGDHHAAGIFLDGDNNDVTIEQTN